MAFATLPQPRPASDIAKGELVKLLNTRSQVPKAIAIGPHPVYIQDLAKRIEAFRQQRKFLAEIGSDWPTARVTKASQGLSYWVPIDLSDPSSTVQDPHFLYNEIASGSAQQRARDSMQSAGLITADKPISHSENVFTEMLGEIIGKRSNYSASGAGSAPPTSNFEVTTDSQGVEVVYADGYFLSTSRGFGYSSPALKQLAHGNYIFGYNGPNGPDFLSGTLWVIPDDSRAHLRV